jgi:hypothetical protein
VHSDRAFTGNARRDRRVQYRVRHAYAAITLWDGDKISGGLLHRRVNAPRALCVTRHIDAGKAILTLRIPGG